MRKVNIYIALLLALSFVFANCTSQSKGNTTDEQTTSEADSVPDSASNEPLGTTDDFQTGEEVWSHVTQWKQLIPWSTFGEPEAYACYDIDDDGIPEAIVRGNFEGQTNYSILTCGNKKGGLGNPNDVEQVINSLQKDMFGIMKGEPFVFVSQSDEIGGYESKQFVKFSNSCVEGFYSLSMQTKDGETSYSYSCIKDDKDVPGFDKQKYQESVPEMISDVVDFDNLDWITITK